MKRFHFLYLLVCLTIFWFDVKSQNPIWEHIGPEGAKVSSLTSYKNKLLALVDIGSQNKKPFLSINGNSWQVMDVSKFNTGYGDGCEQLTQLNDSTIIAATGRGIELSYDFGNTWKVSLSYNTSCNFLKCFNGCIITTNEWGILCSKDNGNSWYLLNKNIDSFSVPRNFFNYFDVDNDGNIYTLGGNAFLKMNLIDSLWHPVFNYTTINYNIYQIASYKNKVYTATDKGIYVVNKGDTNWTLFNNAGIIAGSGINSICFSNDSIYCAAIDGSGIYVSSVLNSNFSSINNGFKDFTLLGNLLFSNGFLFSITNHNIYKYVNGSWQTFSKNLAFSNIENLIFYKNKYLFSSSFGNGIYRSIDNGINWSEKNSGIPNLFVKSFFVDGSILYAGVYAKGMYFSFDEGESWKSFNTGLSDTLTPTLITKLNNELYCIENSFLVYKFNPSANSWEFQFQVEGIINDLKYINGCFYVACTSYSGKNTGLSKSCDNGYSWVPLNSWYNKNY